MKSLPRLALGVFFAAMLAATTHATTQTYSTARWNDTGSAIFSQSWTLNVPSNVNITTSIMINATTANGGGGSTTISRNGVTVLTVSASGPGVHSAGNATFGQPAGTYSISHGFGGPPNTVYAEMYTQFNW
ncbi:MAG TPA: hypothetical protein VIM71_11800 [Lacunisphaera sp.]